MTSDQSLDVASPDFSPQRHGEHGDDGKASTYDQTTQNTALLAKNRHHLQFMLFSVFSVSPW